MKGAERKGAPGKRERRRGRGPAMQKRKEDWMSNKKGKILGGSRKGGFICADEAGGRGSPERGSQVSANKGNGCHMEVTDAYRKKCCNRESPPRGTTGHCDLRRRPSERCHGGRGHLLRLIGKGSLQQRKPIPGSTGKGPETLGDQERKETLSEQGGKNY